MLTENRGNSYAELLPVQIDMSNYPNLLTPPSSNEDSPHSAFYNPSPTSSLSPDPNLFTQPIYGLNFGTNSRSPYMRIMEQPVEKFRFRYKSEMTGTHGSLCGQNSDRSRKQTYPTVELVNFDRPATIRCSIYQMNYREDFKPHAHRLIRKQGKGEVDDPHDLQVCPETGFVCIFHNMGIIHTAKKNIVPELVKKKTKLKCEEIARVEGKFRPLTTKEEVEIKGLAEAESKSINLNVVCLRFDAFYSVNGRLERICSPVYSHGINNLKSALTGELKIVRMDHCTSPAKGGREIFILVERVTKKNIKVKFYELDDEDNILWQDYGRFSDLDVHHQYAIVLKTPPYKNVDITSEVKIYIELERPSDRARSEPKEFRYTPSHNALCRPGAKRARPSYESSSYDTELASDELPVPINNLHIHANVNNPLDHPELELTSVELQEAMKNIDSEEFKKLFSEFSPEYQEAAVMESQSVCVDAPKREFDMARPTVIYTNKNKVNKGPRRVPYTNRVSPQEKLEAKRTLEELQTFIRTKPNTEKAVNMLNYYLGTENKTNILHTLIRENEFSSVMFLLKMIFIWKQNHLLNIKDDDYETPLIIATYNKSEDIVANLLVCKAEVQQGDAFNNTPLHVAVLVDAEIPIFEKLLAVDNIKQIIDLENNDGNTALNLAIDNKNLRAVKLLLRSEADVNRTHMKNGYTPLRFALERQNLEVVKIILQNPKLNPLIEDFQGHNALYVGLQSSNVEILSAIKVFMQDNEYIEVEIKKEVEDNSDEEIEEKFSVKSEQISPEELRDMYSNFKEFAPEYLDEISRILDRSGTWQNLADLLDLSHLTGTVLCEGQGSPTKKLLQLALKTNGDTVLQIRDFLENLDETRAVEIIDNMVRSQFV